MFKIAQNYSPMLKKQCPTEISKLFLHFKKMMTLATKDKPLVCFFNHEKKICVQSCVRLCAQKADFIYKKH